MRSHRAYGTLLREAFRLPEAPILTTTVLRKSTISVTELRCDQPKFGRTAPLPAEDAYLVALQFRACPDHDLYFEGRLTRPENYGPGVTSIYDLRRSPVADIRDPYHCLMFYLPRTALDAVASEAGAPRPGDLRHTPGVSVDDPVVRHLLSSLLPAMKDPQQANSLFLDHVALAMTAHLASHYAGMDTAPVILRGGLAPWQERRAKELMAASLNQELPLSRLAAECGLSVGHFARAFRRSVGVPPHRWFLSLRVERAKELLGARALSLADVAIFCGFADQSHLTRSFTAAVGVSPGTWRRIHAPTGSRTGSPD
ncbi:MAG TPA: AraC family transcriptional regulator [Bryobacteraceae bacterium]|jgi:AraC-like DNA-binding protein